MFAGVSPKISPLLQKNTVENCIRTGENELFCECVQYILVYQVCQTLYVVAYGLFIHGWRFEYPLQKELS